MNKTLNVFDFVVAVAVGCTLAAMVYLNFTWMIESPSFISIAVGSGLTLVVLAYGWFMYVDMLLEAYDGLRVRAA